MPLNLGDTVKVLTPFDEAFPDSYAITEIVQNTDGSVVYILGECGGFDACYLELAP